MKNTLMALSLVLGLGYATAQQTTPAQKKSEPAKKEMKGHETAKRLRKRLKNSSCEAGKSSRKEVRTV